MMQGDSRQAGAFDYALSPEEIGVYGDRGVYVPKGMTAAEIMKGAEVLERNWDVAPYLSRMMVCEVMSAVSAARASS